jgi:hypothetical protein
LANEPLAGRLWIVEANRRSYKQKLWIGPLMKKAAYPSV